jgi:hypothetical protein
MLVSVDSTFVLVYDDGVLFDVGRAGEGGDKLKSRKNINMRRT